MNEAVIIKRMPRGSDPCPYGSRLFHRMFPEGARVTAESFKKALKARLAIGWFLQRLTGSACLVLDNRNFILPQCSGEPRCKICDRLEAKIRTVPGYAKKAAAYIREAVKSAEAK